MSTFSLTDLQPVAASHIVLQHPVLASMRDGRYKSDRFKFWLGQQYFFSISLAHCFSAIYARSNPDDWSNNEGEEVITLPDLISVESWSSNAAQAHSQYFRELASYVDLDISNLEPTDYTSQFLANRLDLCLHGHLPSAIAAIGVGNEDLNVSLYESYKSFAISCFDDCPLGYFDAHLRDEPQDFAVFDRLYKNETKSVRDHEIAKDSLTDQLADRCEFYSCLERDFAR